MNLDLVFRISFFWIAFPFLSDYVIPLVISTVKRWVLIILWKNCEVPIFLDFTGFTPVFLFVIPLFFGLLHHIYTIFMQTTSHAGIRPECPLGACSQKGSFGIRPIRRQPWPNELVREVHGGFPTLLEQRPFWQSHFQSLPVCLCVIKKQ